LAKGLDKLEVDDERLVQDLAANWAVLAEPVQTVMRRYGVDNPYEQLKVLTRGRSVDAETFVELIDALDVPAEARAALRSLEPATYIGLAEVLARDHR